ncbi:MULTISPECIES: MFS transporter [Sphingobium]|uniref:MFS transporter n=1 Tax=Sphingobium sp. MI1205 TaxID=407020 RepID=UPI0007701417|nr:MFS transporter [Sphingobium sp. MI1205]AMK19853.1 major facilitator transporter [Sphingobium sp. MI1205]
MTVAASSPSASSFHGWRMVAITFLILNCVLGVNFAAYGAMVEAIQREFNTSRALASAGLSMVTLALGLLSPLVGALMQRVSIKWIMISGVVLNALGFVALTQINSIGLLLAIYVLMIGPGVALAGPVTCTAVISNWFNSGRGKALGIINMPAGNTLMPLLAALLLSQYGLQVAFLSCALILALLLPIMWFLVDAPEKIGQHAKGAAADSQRAETVMTAAQILRSQAFLVLTAGVTLLSCAGLVMVTHIVALATDRGIDLGSASLLLSAFGLAGIVGAPLFGWVADRIGGGRTFALIALLQIAPWLGLMGAGNSLPLLLVCAFIIGMCSNAILTLFGATMGSWLGSANVGLGMGLCYTLQIPFMFGAGPLAGAMFDHFGSYGPTVLLHVSTFVLIGVLFLVYRPRPLGVSMSPPAAG